MAERPPPGYNKRDKPLPHEFHQKITLKIADDSKNKYMMTFLRTSLDSVDPKTIEVNPRNSAFAADTGPVICYDSIVQMMTISQDIMMTEQALTDGIQAMAVYDWNIHGAFEDSWTPADEKTTTTIAQLLHVTSDTTKEDVVPETVSTDMIGSDVPVSTVTMPEVFGDYNLSTDLTPQNTSAQVDMVDEIFDAKQYYTNGAKLNSLMGTMNRTILNKQTRTHASKFEKRFTPRNVRFGNPHLYFGRQYHVPISISKSQLTEFDMVFAGTRHVAISIRVRFNEWNPDFNQARM